MKQKLAISLTLLMSLNINLSHSKTESNTSISKSKKNTSRNVHTASTSYTKRASNFKAYNKESLNFSYSGLYKIKKHSISVKAGIQRSLINTYKYQSSLSNTQVFYHIPKTKKRKQYIGIVLPTNSESYEDQSLQLSSIYGLQYKIINNFGFSFNLVKNIHRYKTDNTGSQNQSWIFMPSLNFGGSINNRFSYEFDLGFDMAQDYYGAQSDMYLSAGVGIGYALSKKNSLSLNISKGATLRNVDSKIYGGNTFLNNNNLTYIGSFSATF